MKIEDPNLTASLAAGQAQPFRAIAAYSQPKSGQAGAVPGDRVDLSHLGGSLARTLAADAQSRAGRIEALAARFQSGNYAADAASTSRAIVREALSASGSGEAK